MKILLVNKFHYLKGGSETYYFGLGFLLAQHGHDVIYFSMKDPKNRPCSQEQYFVDHVDFNSPMAKWNMVKAGLKMLYSLEAGRKLEKLIEKEKPDIAHLNIFQSQLTASVVDVLYKHQIPIVYTMHDLKSLCPCYTMLTHGSICEKCSGGNYFYCIKNKCMKDSLAKSLLAAVEAEVYRIKRTYQKMDLIITPSAFYKQKLEAAHITYAPVIHIPNFLPQNAEQVSNIVRGTYFLYFGRLSKEKGILTLVEAYKRASLKLPLYIVGTGPIKEEIEQRIRNLALNKRVKMLGYKQGKELHDLVANSLCVILPSEWYENGPYSAIEALQMGRPLIGANIGGIPELINGNGRLFPSGNIDALAKSMVDLEKLGDQDYIKFCKASRQLYLNQYGNPEKYEQIVEVYQKVIQCHAK